MVAARRLGQVAGSAPMTKTLTNSGAIFNVRARAVSWPVLVSGDARHPFLPESGVTPPTIVHSEVDTAIERAQAALLAAQAPDGHWVGELEADSTITSEYLLLCHMLDRVDRDREAKMVKYLRERQLPDGGWSLYEGGPPNISATIKAYFAMKVAGVSVDDPAMEQARARVRDWGGPVEANVFTKILLALFGEYDWRGVPSMPVEIMLLPRWSYFNLLEVSYWSRTVIVPLLILMDSKPVKRLPDSCRLDELWPVPREQASLRLKRIPRPFPPSASSGRTSSSGWTMPSRAGSGWARGRSADAPSRRPGAGSRSGWPCRAAWAASSPP